MRILFAHNNLGYFGGVEQNVADTAEALGKQGHSCYLAYGSRTRDAQAYGEIFAATRPCREFDTGEEHSLYEWADHLQPDLIYYHKVPDSIVLNPPRCSPVVRMVHDHDLCCPRRHKYFAWNSEICNKPAGARCYLDGAFLVRDRTRTLGIGFESIARKLRVMKANWQLDALFVGSRFMRDELLMNGCPPEKVTIVPPAVQWQAPEQVHPLTRDPHILYVGQLIRGKGVDLLLQALAELSTDFKVKIVGEGNAREGLQQQTVELGLQSRVEFLGWCDHKELQELYTWARMVCVPSRWPEPFGMVGIEAMAHAKPVVAFAAGGIPDWLEDGSTGLLTAAGDVQGLAQALHKLLQSDSLAQEFGTAGRHRALREYSFDRLIQQLSDALTNALQTNLRKSA